jgi:hypothetical protein
VFCVLCFVVDGQWTAGGSEQSLVQWYWQLEAERREAESKGLMGGLCTGENHQHHHYRSYAIFIIVCAFII